MLDDLELFVAVVEHGSFTKAAQILGISKSAASKKLAQLEARLGTRLLERTTRAMRLTEAGQLYFDRAAQIVAAAGEAEQEVARRQNTAIGSIRVSAPVSFGIRYLGGPIASFTKKHPKVSVEIDLSDRKVDLIEEGYDVAIRAGELQDSSLVARSIASSAHLIVASPEYLRRVGRPRTPADLGRHEVLLYRHQASGRTWHFSGREGRRRTVRVHGRMQSNNGDILAEAACAGVGVGLLPDFIVQPHVEAGRLQVLMAQWCRQRVDIHAVYPSRHPSLKVRRFVDELEAALAD